MHKTACTQPQTHVPPQRKQNKIRQHPLYNTHPLKGRGTQLPSTQ